MSTVQTSIWFDYADKRIKELIVFGFIHKIQNELNKEEIIPNDIIKICIEYCKKINIYFVNPKSISNIIDPKFDNGMQKTVQSLPGNKTIVYVSTTKLTQNMNGVYEWSLKCIKKDNNDQIGAVKSINNIDHSSFMNTLLFNSSYQDSYYYWNYVANIWRHNDSNYFKIDKVVWEKDDIIQVKINCTNWTIQWLHNTISLGGPFKLDKNIDTLYPAIAYGGSASLYQNVLD